MYDIKSEYFFDRIKELCKERGWSKYKLMKECDIASSTYYDMFNKKILPRLDVVERICTGMNITMAELFEEFYYDDGVLTEYDKSMHDVTSRLDNNDRNMVMAYAQALDDKNKHRGKKKKSDVTH